MVVGVNGVGKTTTIGKLAHQFKQAGNQWYLVLQILSGLQLWTN
jgi:signal recognition particle GTPase